MKDKRPKPPPPDDEAARIFRDLKASQGRRKYRNQPVVCRGIRFDSKREARRYGELLMMRAGGVIKDLERQVTYRLEVNGALICKYVADFRYAEAGGRIVVEDAKGCVNRVFRLKKKLMMAVHGIEVVEV